MVSGFASVFGCCVFEWESSSILAPGGKGPNSRRSMGIRDVGVECCFEWESSSILEPNSEAAATSATLVSTI